MIRLDNISKQHGHQILFIDASMGLQKGEKVGLVGPNGAGKTTIFRMIAGTEQPDDGQVTIDPGMTIGYFSQDVGEMSGHSAVAEVMNGVGPVSDLGAELKELEAAMADPARADEMDDIVARYGEVQARFEELDGYALESRAREVLAGLSFSQEMMDGDVGALSGGWKMRVALARILLMRPDAMLLDEPSNHLDLESLIWLEQFLKGYEGMLFMTSHDREFMNRIVNKVVEIDAGSLTSYTGNYEFYAQQRALADKQQQAQFERQQAMLAKEIQFIERFKARASHAAQVQSRVKKLEKIEKVEPPRRRQTVQFDFPPAPRSGDDVVNLKNVHKAYGSKTIYDGFDLTVRRKERWCVMGVNGAGKSTLLKLVAGSTEPDTGSVAVGGSVKMGYFAQHAMDLLDGDQTVFESLEHSFPQAGQGSLRTLAGAEPEIRQGAARRRAQLPMGDLMHQNIRFAARTQHSAVPAQGALRFFVQHGDAAAARDLGARLLHERAGDEEQVDPHERDAGFAVVEDGCAHLARIMERAVVALPVAAGRLHPDAGSDVAFGEAGLEAAGRERRMRGVHGSNENEDGEDGGGGTHGGGL